MGEVGHRQQLAVTCDAQNVAGSTIPVAERIVDEDLDTEIVWSATESEPATVTMPRPRVGESRPQTTLVIGTGTSTVTVAEIAGVSRTVTFDPAGRTLTETDGVGRMTSTEWSGDLDSALSTTSGGRKTTTIFDAETRTGWHPVDTYGPAPTACFGANRKPVAAPLTTPGCGIAQIPRTHVDYDHNLKGLQGTAWSNPGFDGAPAGHGMGPNANGDIDYSWVGATAPPGVGVGDNWTARYMGQISPATPGLGYTLRIVVGPNDVGTLYINDVAQAVATGNGSVDGTSAVTFTDANPWRVRIDFRAGLGNSKLRLGWTPAGGTETFALGTAVKPGFFYATRSTTDDTTGSTQVPATMVSETRFDEGIDPVYAIPTSTTVDPSGTALKTVTGFETPGTGSLLRRTRRTLPAFAGAPSSANSTTYNYYANADVADNPCIAGTQNAPQAGLAKQTISAAPATGTAITTETVYDIVGRPLASRYVPDSVWTCTVYDARGRVVQVVFPADATYPAGRSPPLQPHPRPLPRNRPHRRRKRQRLPLPQRPDQRLRPRRTQRRRWRRWRLLVRLHQDSQQGSRLRRKQIHRLRRLQRHQTRRRMGLPWIGRWLDGKEAPCCQSPRDIVSFGLRHRVRRRYTSEWRGNGQLRRCPRNRYAGAERRLEQQDSAVGLAEHHDRPKFATQHQYLLRLRICRWLLFS